MNDPLSMADDAIAFPTLDASELAVLATLGTRSPMGVGEYLYQEGDATYDFYVIRSGAVEIVVRIPMARSGSSPAMGLGASWAS